MCFCVPALFSVCLSRFQSVLWCGPITMVISCCRRKRYCSSRRSSIDICFGWHRWGDRIFCFDQDVITLRWCRSLWKATQTINSHVSVHGIHQDRSVTVGRNGPTLAGDSRGSHQDRSVRLVREAHDGHIVMTV